MHGKEQKRSQRLRCILPACSPPAWPGLPAWLAWLGWVGYEFGLVISDAPIHDLLSRQVSLALSALSALSTLSVRQSMHRALSISAF